MTEFVVIADYRTDPAEGMQAISKALVDGLRCAAHSVEVVKPASLPRRLLGLVLRRPKRVVFTHGPGKGGVIASVILRNLTGARIIWVATRPEVDGLPRILRGWQSAHVVVCNRVRKDLQAVAPGAVFRRQFIGIDPGRLHSSAGQAPDWAKLRAIGRPIALHVGHLRRNRGLDLLVEAKKRLGDRIEIVVQASPTFAPNAGLVEELKNAGLHVHCDYVRDLAGLYAAADLYLFPVRPDEAGAVELPLSAIEAVACRLPVLSTAYGALPDALAEVAGVRFASPDAFAASLEAMLDEPGALSVRPLGLPKALHADRITNAVIQAAELN